jgi:hypothetical protein
VPVSIEQFRRASTYVHVSDFADRMVAGHLAEMFTSRQNERLARAAGTTDPDR